MGVTLRPLRSADRAALEEIVRAQTNFTPEEMETAMEVLDEALDGDPGYIVNVIDDDDGRLAGYECHGPTPLTEGTFDLYWIAVDPRIHKRGFGQRLMHAAEADVVQRGGRLLLIETSSQESYGATIRFYERAGYDLAARIKNFYRPGDDKLVFAKELTPAAASPE